MSLSWANKFAKNALLNAQKRIDSVLDIKESEEESSERPQESEVEQLESDIEPAHISELSDTTEVESNNGNESVKFDTNEDSFITAHDGESHTRLVDVDLSAEQQTSGWDLSPDEDIVETEPNPIRDTHDHPSTSIIQYSPSSNSPDEDNQDHDHQPSSQQQHFDLSLIQLEQTEHHADTIPTVHREKLDRQHEDVLTVASSDIVVIKNADDWSVASGSHRRTGSDQASLSAYAHNQKSSDDESMHEKMMTLEAKIKHQDQRLKELNRLNENLRSQNATLTQRNKQVSIKLAEEAKLKKQLVEKENELKELMDEGKNLSKQNAKQSKELKRLRDIEKEYELQICKLGDANEEVDRRADLETQLKDHLRKAEAKLEEKNAEIAKIQEKVHQKQDLADDFKLSEQRCQNQKLQIAKLEQRIDELMAAQRASAEQIAELNAPLLTNIDELETKLRETETEKYVLQKKVRLAEENVSAATRKSADEIKMLKQQLDSLRNSNGLAQEKIQRMKSDYDELNEQHKKLGELSQSVETKLLAEIAEFKESLIKKDAEITELKHELMVATKPKTPSSSPLKTVTPQEDNHADLLEDFQELERENSSLRTNYNELKHEHETLLLLHGESIVRNEELEEENKNIKDVCKEQALMVASLKRLGNE